jgi:hypothetical protein
MRFNFIILVHCDKYGLTTLNYMCNYIYGRAGRRIAKSK